MATKDADVKDISPLSSKTGEKKLSTTHQLLTFRAASPEILNMILNSLEYYTDDLAFRLSSRNVYAATPRPEVVERYVWDQVQQSYEKRDQEIKVADFLEKEFQVSVGLGYLRDMATKRWCKSCYKIVRQEVMQHLTP
ncbi:hypothetical protein G7Y79_00001g000510 [Physcia stellaris]|nr:hypothetical protein G7Y79_00001g000510 [Physcia stellaris]